MGRDCVSDRIATTVPDSTLQSLKTEVNVSIHLPSILSCNISFPFFQSITFRRYRPFCMKLILDSTINNTFHKTQESIFFISSAIYFILTTRFTTYCKNRNFMSQSPTDHRNLGDFIVRQLNI